MSVLEKDFQIRKIELDENKEKVVVDYFPQTKSKNVTFTDGETLQEKFDNGVLGGGAGGADEEHIANKVIHITSAERAKWNAAEFNAKEYAEQLVDSLIDAAPEAMDTLKELSDALGNDPNFATTIATEIGKKADKGHVHTKSEITNFPTSMPANGGTSSFLGNAVNIADYNTLVPTKVAQGNITPIKAGSAANSPWSNTTSGFLIQSNDQDSFHILIFRSGGDGWAYRSYYQGAWKSWVKWATTEPVQPDWNATSGLASIKNKPTSFPASGGDADTLDGYHASDFLKTAGGTVRGTLSVSGANINATNGNFYTNQYMQMEARSGYGAGVASMWYDSTNNAKILNANNVSDLVLDSNKVYHEGRKPTAAEIGAAAASHGTHVSYGTSTNGLTQGSGGTTGTSGSVARADHTHALPSYPTLTSLGAAKKDPIRLAQGTNLDTLVDNGIYASGSDGESATLINRPPGTQGFILKVEVIWGSGASGRIMQTAYMRTARTMYMRDRDENTTTWKGWVKFYNENNKPTASDIGASPIAGSTSLNTLAGTVKFGTGGPMTVEQNDGSWWQKLAIGDSSDLAIHRLAFSERQGAGDYVELFGVDGNGEIYSKNRKVYHTGNKPTLSDIGAAPTSHTHTKSQITDFPTSIPANGGNSDTVDNLHASSFLRADADSTLTGGKSVVVTTGTNVVKTSHNAISGGADAASSLDANLRLHSWYGIGFASTIANQAVPQGENATWFNVRTGNAYTRGDWYAQSDKKVYHQGFKPTASDVGALPTTGGSLASTSFGVLNLERTGSTNGASIGFRNSNGLLGYIGMNSGVNSGLKRWSADTNTEYTILDTGNYKTTVTPSNIGAAAASHTHSYLPLSGGTLTGTLTATQLLASGNSKTATIGTGTTDVYLRNSASNKYLQLKDDGSLSYDGKTISHSGLSTLILSQPDGQFPKPVITTYNANTNGIGVAITGGALTIVGGGESANAIVSAEGLTTTSESLFLTADNNIEFRTNCNTIADRVSASLNTLGDFTLTGKLSTPKVTSTYILGNQGNALLNSTAGPGNYVMFNRYPSTNGYFTMGGHQNKWLLQYTAKSTVDAGTNGTTKAATLLDENGNSAFPGSLSTGGPLSVNTGGSTASDALFINGSQKNGKLWAGTGGFVVQSVGSTNLHLGCDNTTDMVFYSNGITVTKTLRVDNGHTLQMGRSLYGSTDVGVSGNHSGGSATLGGVQSWMKSNNYYDGSGDKFMNSSMGASQFWLNGTGYPQFRWSTNTPSTNGTVSWSSTYEMLTTYGNQTMKGPIIFDTGSEKAVKASHNWGMYLNNGAIGWYDWANGRSVFAYSVSADMLTTYRKFKMAGGQAYIVDRVTPEELKLSMSAKTLSNVNSIDDYTLINTKNGVATVKLNSLHKAKPLSVEDEEGVETNPEKEFEGTVEVGFEVGDIVATLVSEVKRLKEENSQLKTKIDSIMEKLGIS